MVATSVRAALGGAFHPRLRVAVEALLPYVLHRQKSVCVEYSGEHAVMFPARDATPRTAATSYALTICRIEPENNCELLIEAFLRSSQPSYVFVGNWDRSDYGRALRRRYAGERRLQLLDPIYDPAELFRLRRSCSRYLHGHSVGGTNPSLVEILFFDCEILCWDCSFNRVTAGQAARYFFSADELAGMLSTEPASIVDRSEVRRRYSTRTIVAKLRAAFTH